MEPITIFAYAVAFICGCHVVFSAVSVLEKGGRRLSRPAAKRTDWFCFFDTADLLGTKGASQVSSVAQVEQGSPRRHPSRPRLRA